MKGTFDNGCNFVSNHRGQKVDEDGFATSSLTFITNRRTCVSVKFDGEGVLVRDTKDPQKTTLNFSKDEWIAFIGGVKKGEFDI